MNMCKDNNENDDNEINSLVSLFSECKLIKTECVICKKITKETIKKLCYNNCCFVCHEDCLKTWILHKKYDSICVICGIKYGIDLIDKVIYQHVRDN